MLFYLSDNGGNKPCELCFQEAIKIHPLVWVESISIIRGFPEFSLSESIYSINV